MQRPRDCLWDGVGSWHHPHRRARVALVPLEVHEMRVQVPGRVLEYAAQKGVAVQLVRRAFQLLAIVYDEDIVVCDALDLEHLHRGPGVQALQDPPDFFWGAKLCTEQLN